MSASGHASFKCVGKIVQKRDEFRGGCLVIGEKFVYVKLVCSVMQ